jgi:hypothetical protein
MYFALVFDCGGKFNFDLHKFFDLRIKVILFVFSFCVEIAP